MEHIKQQITTFLMFDGKAEEAMHYYVSAFDRAEILSIHRYQGLVTENIAKYRFL